MNTWELQTSNSEYQISQVYYIYRVSTVLGNVFSLKLGSGPTEVYAILGNFYNLIFYRIFFSRDNVKFYISHMILL